MSFRPPRFDGSPYRGPVHCVFSAWTDRRAPYFTDFTLASAILVQLFHTCQRDEVSVDAYCLLPDRAEILLSTESPSASVLVAFEHWKHRTALLAWRLRRPHLWEPGYTHRVLRSDEDPAVAVAAILAAPVRSGLARDVGDYPLAGIAIGGVERVEPAPIAAVSGNLWPTA